MYWKAWWKWMSSIETILFGKVYLWLNYCELDWIWKLDWYCEQEWFWKLDWFCELICYWIVIEIWSLSWNDCIDGRTRPWLWLYRSGPRSWRMAHQADIGLGWSGLVHWTFMNGVSGYHPCCHGWSSCIELFGAIARQAPILAQGERAQNPVIR